MRYTHLTLSPYLKITYVIVVAYLKTYKSLK
jgi:hypothetical protein